MKGLQFEERWFEPIEFANRGRELEMARQLSFINQNWGRVEYWLYLIILPVGPQHASEWTTDFFESISWSEKVRKVKREITVLSEDDAELAKSLKSALDEFEGVQEKRNKLIHGLWARTAEAEFDVQPLTLTSGGFSIEDSIKVDMNFIQGLSRSFERVRRRLGALGVEVLALRELQKRERRRRRSLAKPRSD